MIGCIADDFTGAGDIASFFAKGGMRTILCNGISKDNLTDSAEAVVVALKSRTQKTEDAVRDSLNAVKWLRGQGCDQIYIKYCSTFDSTPKGNIGPICDAVMEYLDVPYTILAPALPVNGRTVSDGKLYVYGVPLHESSMKDHPLTPMWDAEIRKLMEPQSRYPVYSIGRNLQELPEQSKASRYYLVPDCENEEDIKDIVSQFGKLKLLTGGSGLAQELARTFRNASSDSSSLQQFERRGDAVSNNRSSNTLILSGSCSVMTRKQIADYVSKKGRAIELKPEALIRKEVTPLTLWNSIKSIASKENILIYTSDTPENVSAIKAKYGDVSGILEDALAEIAALAMEDDIRNIIVAGGETSGAVTKRIGADRYWIGESAAPGVPVMIPVDQADVKIVLKSGNFGAEDFFSSTIGILQSYHGG